MKNAIFPLLRMIPYHDHQKNLEYIQYNCLRSFCKLYPKMTSLDRRSVYKTLECKSFLRTHEQNNGLH